MTQLKKIFQLVADIIAIHVALCISYYWFTNGISFFQTYGFQVTTILADAIWMMTLFFSNHLYMKFEYKSIEDEIKYFIPNFIIFVVGFYIITIFFYKTEGFSYSLFFSSFITLLLASRIFMKYIMSHKTLNYMTIGYCDTISRIEEALHEAHRGKTQYLGTFCASNKSAKTYLGSAEGISDFLKSNKVNLILYVSNTLTPDRLQEVMHYAKYNFIEFKIIPLELDYLTEGAKLELHHGVFLSAKDEYFVRFTNQFLKRGFDIIFSSLVIVFILSWLFPLLCLLIVLETKGAPLFVQHRVGLRGEVFKCLKFRSMIVRENGAIVEQAKRNDSRVTRIGAFLRRSNLDEMPQFFNVFLGNMSVVGPRPHAVSHDTQFKNLDEDYNLRHYLKPGITGWAQVNGWRGPTDTPIKIIGRTECDLWYIRNLSLGLDIKIIFLTIFGSKGKENAF